MANSPMMKLEERPKISIAFERSPKEQSEKGGRKLEVSDYTQSAYTFNSKPTIALFPGNTRRDVNYRGALNTTAKSIL